MEPVRSEREGLLSARHEQASACAEIVARATLVNIESAMMNSQASQKVRTSIRSPTISTGCNGSRLARSRSPSPSDVAAGVLCRSSRSYTRLVKSPAIVRAASPASPMRSLSPRRQEARVVGVSKGATFTIGNPLALTPGVAKVKHGTSHLYNSEVPKSQESAEVETPDKVSRAARYKASAVQTKGRPTTNVCPDAQASTASAVAPAVPDGPPYPIPPCTMAEQETVQSVTAGREAVSNVRTDALALVTPITWDGLRNTPRERTDAGFVSLPEAAVDWTAQDVEDSPCTPQTCHNSLSTPTLDRYPGLFIPPTPAPDAYVFSQQPNSILSPRISQQSNSILSPRIITPLTKRKCRRKNWSNLQPHVHAACEKITRALDDRAELKKLVLTFFKKAVYLSEGLGSISELFEESAIKRMQTKEAPTSQSHKVGEVVLDMNGLTTFVDLISAHLDLPPYAFGQLEDAFAMYDFDGDGSITVGETYKFVKDHLDEYREQLGGAPHTLEISWKTPEEAGYQILHELGRGNHGIAKLALKKGSMEVCLKVISKAGCRESRVDDMIKEYNAMSALSCERIAGVQTMFQDEACFYMVCDLYRGGDLLRLRENAEGQGVIMTLEWWRRIFRQCIEALAFMHKQAIMHCDIKEANIMLKTKDCREPQIVVIDLGVSTSCARQDEGTPSGSPGYVPPETLTSLKWYPRGDIFSLGVTIFQVVCGMKPPESGLFIEGCHSVRDIFKATLEREPPWDRFPRNLANLKCVVAKMLEKERILRPLAPQVLLDSCFTCTDAHKTLSCNEPHENVVPEHEFAAVGIQNVVQSLTRKLGFAE